MRHGAIHHAGTPPLRGRARSTELLFSPEHEMPHPAGGLYAIELPPGLKVAAEERWLKADAL